VLQLELAESDFHKAKVLDPGNDSVLSGLALVAKKRKFFHLKSKKMSSTMLDGLQDGEK